MFENFYYRGSVVDYIPDLTQLPSFALRLATDVDWNSEKNCFDTLSRNIAMLYRRPNDSKVTFLL